MKIIARKNKMKDTKLNAGIRDIRKIVMTPEEKKRMFESVLNTPIVPLGKQSIRSPWAKQYFTLMVDKNRQTLFYGVVLFFIAMLFGGGIVLASQESLPGSILYPLKVNVIEPIRSALKVYPEAKIKEKSSLLTTESMVQAEIPVDQNN